MKTLLGLACLALGVLNTPFTYASLFINEFHYDNSGQDVNEGIELAGLAGTDLSGFHLLLYNGSNGNVYSDILLQGVLPDQSSGYGALFFAASLQNGPDGIALADNNGVVLQFISYEGSFTAANGAAAGMSSTDIGVFQSSDNKENVSLQLAGMGEGSFTWILDTASSGQLNAQQGFATPVPVPATLPLLISALTFLGLKGRHT